MSDVLGEDPFQAPADGEEFCTRDSEHVHGLTRRHLGSTVQNAEDVAQYILARLIEREVWTMYDPTRKSEYTGKPVTWRTFLSSIVMSYLRGRRESLYKQAGHEVLLCDVPVGEGGVPWVELHGGATWDDYSALEDAEFITRMREYLAVQPEQWNGGPTLLAMFDFYYDRLRQGDKLTRRDVQQRFSLSGPAATARVRWLYEAMRSGVTAQPVNHKFDIGGVVLTAAQLRAAADALREAPGNRVSPALASVDSPLAGYPSQFYIQLGRQEVRACPDIKRAKGTHQGGHSDATKVYLIHLFERLLAEAGSGVPVAAEPEPEVTAREVFESALWRMKLSKEQVIAISDAAEKIYGDVA